MTTFSLLDVYMTLQTGKIKFSTIQTHDLYSLSLGLYITRIDKLLK